jgi:UDP-N-acetylmuramate--alanine ligase
MNQEVYHFIGLGGIGMSALARILLQRGATVQGSDLASSCLLEELRQEGASVRIGHTGELSNATQVVYSTAVQDENADLVSAKKWSLPVFHRSDLLHFLMKGRHPLLVTGTHGKTTTTALLASVLIEAGLDPTFVIGGIDQKLKTNARAGMGAYFVAEADESDGSFLKTPSFGAIVTNLENDHLDFWSDVQHLDAAFKEFFDKSLHPKHLFWCGDDTRLKNLNPQGISYGFSPDNSLCIPFFEPTASGICFDVEWDGTYFSQIKLSLFGRHNALNGAAVFGLALSLGIAEATIRKAFLEFQGVSRRLEWKGAACSVDVYDDYGHHPTEIAATIKALRDKVLERRLIAVFQPHRYTRVRALFYEFCTSFSDADLVVITDIYGAGESPIPGVTSKALFEQMKLILGTRLHYVPRRELESGVATLSQPHDVIMTLGAGDVTLAHKKILEDITRKAPKLTVGLLFGGTSSEHDVSLLSARTFIEAIDRGLYRVKLFGLTKQGHWLSGEDALERLEKNEIVSLDEPLISPEILQELTSCDVAIPIFHGQQGEDGMTQGLLDTLAISYVGCDYRSGALCMQKGWTKLIAQMAGIPTSSFVEMDKATYLKNPEKLIQRIESYPVWIKPVHLGSSIGITRVIGPEGVHDAAKRAFALDDTLIADKEIKGREIEFSLLGNDFIRVAPAGEIIKQDIFHSFDKKYGAGASPIEIPALLTEMQIKIGEGFALEMFKRAGCKGLARIDFFLDESGHFWMNEINPMPGFTGTSAYPKMWEAAGFSMQKMCDELIILAMHRSRQLTQIRGK